MNNQKESKGEEKEDDYVTKSIGAFGCWQFIFICIGSLTRMTTVWNTTSILFIAPETEFICKKFKDNATVELKNNTCYDTCIEYEYTNDIFQETIISEFGLICKDKWLRSFAQTVMMSGVLCGVAIFGWFSDRFGRSKAMILSGIISAISMLATSFCPTFWSVVAARFFTGIGSGGLLALTSVFMFEIIGSRMVDIIICVCLLPVDGAGLSVQAIFAYFSRKYTWRALMLVSGSLTAFVACLTLFIPETPRWLIAKGKEVDAIELMTKAAKFNKRSTLHISENAAKATGQLSLKMEKDINLTYFDLFRTKKIATWTVTFVSVWFLNGFCYYGLVQQISTFGSNFYVVVIVLGLGQVLGAPLSIAVVKLCSRKVSALCIFSIIGVLSLAQVFVPKGTITAVVLGSLGVITVSVSVSLVYIIVLELYPTPVRNMGISAGSIGSKAGAMVAPFVANITSPWIASLIFSAAGFLGVLFCCMLPETKGQKLKDTFDDVK